MTNVVFGVNTAKPEKEDKYIARQLKNVVGRSAQLRTKEEIEDKPIPISW